MYWDSDLAVKYNPSMKDISDRHGIDRKGTTGTVRFWRINKVTPTQLIVLF
jgi:hypothetical protein